MATAQAMEEELQQSVLRSESGNWEANEGAGDGFGVDSTRGNVNGTIFIAQNAKTRDESVVEDEAMSDRDASGEEEEEMEEDAEGEEDLDLLQETRGSILAHGLDDNEDDINDEDAEGEEDDGEAVGAVKIQPNDADEDMDEDDGSEVSEAPSAAADEDEDSEEEAEEEEEGAWEDARDTAEDEDSDAAPTNVCIFCEEDEEHDPSEEFETFLACVGCGDGGEYILIWLCRVLELTVISTPAMRP